MIKVCHVCLKALDKDEKPYAWIKPKGGRTRYYCESCWMKEQMIATGASPLIEANHKGVK